MLVGIALSTAAVAKRNGCLQRIADGDPQIPGSNIVIPRAPYSASAPQIIGSRGFLPETVGVISRNFPYRYGFVDISGKQQGQPPASVVIKQEENVAGGSADISGFGGTSGQGAVAGQRIKQEESDEEAEQRLAMPLRRGGTTTTTTGGGGGVGTTFTTQQQQPQTRTNFPSSTTYPAFPAPQYVNPFPGYQPHSYPPQSVPPSTTVPLPGQPAVPTVPAPPAPTTTTTIPAMPSNLTYAIYNLTELLKEINSATGRRFAHNSLKIILDPNYPIYIGTEQDVSSPLLAIPRIAIDRGSSSTSVATSDKESYKEISTQSGDIITYYIPRTITPVLELDKSHRTSSKGLNEAIPSGCMTPAGIAATSFPMLSTSEESPYAKIAMAVNSPPDIIIEPGKYKYDTYDEDVHAAWYERCLVEKKPPKKNSSCDRGLLYVHPISFLTKFPEHAVAISTVASARQVAYVSEDIDLGATWSRNMVHMFIIEYLMVAQYITDWLDRFYGNAVAESKSVSNLSLEPPYIALDSEETTATTKTTTTTTTDKQQQQRYRTGLNIWECDARMANYRAWYGSKFDDKPSWIFFSSINFNHAGDIVPLGNYINDITDSADRTHAATDAISHIKGILADLFMLRYFPVNLTINSFGVRTIRNIALNSYKTTIILLPVPHRLHVANFKAKIHDAFRTIPENVIIGTAVSSPGTATYPVTPTSYDTQFSVTGMPPPPPTLPSPSAPKSSKRTVAVAASQSRIPQEKRTMFYRYLTEFFPSWMPPTANPSTVFRATRYSAIIGLTTDQAAWDSASDAERNGYINYHRLREEIIADDARVMNENTINRIIETMIREFKIQFT